MLYIMYFQVEAGLVSDSYQITIKQSCNKGKQVMMYVLCALCACEFIA